jgi:hypothetical protein
LLIKSQKRHYDLPGTFGGLIAFCVVKIVVAEKALLARRQFVSNNM